MTALVSFLTASGATRDVNPANVVAVYERGPTLSRIVGPAPSDDVDVVGDVATVAAALAPYAAAQLQTSDLLTVYVSPTFVVSVLEQRDVFPFTARLVMTSPANDIVVMGGVPAVVAVLDAAFPPPPVPVPTLLPQRRDLSVNGARVESFQDAFAAVMVTQTNANAAGSFNGGGTGNKSFLGHWLDAEIPLVSFQDMDLTVDWLVPEATTAPAGNWLPYANLLVRLQPGDPPAAWAVFVLMSTAALNAGLNVGTLTPQGGTRYSWGWHNPTSYLQVVNDVGMVTPPAGPVPVPVVQGPPIGSGTWNDRAFALSDILVAYPNAAVVNGLKLDGGFPAATPMAGLLLALGDSSNHALNAVRVLAWDVNGATV